MRKHWRKAILVASILAAYAVGKEVDTAAIQAILAVITSI